MSRALSGAAFAVVVSVAGVVALAQPAAGAPQAAGAPPPADAQVGPAFAKCIAGLRADAPARGVSTQAYDRYTQGLVPDRTVLELLDRQPEFKTPIWDYMAALVDDERVADGRAMLGRWRDTLAEVERRYGVDRHTVVAVWGVESDFGKSFGTRPLLNSLATLSCEGRRQSFFRGEFYAALRIVQDGHVDAERLIGSWAGAFGHTQFMPSSFMRLAVDFDGDGRRDIVGSVPDALASTANFLVRAGWNAGQPWGYEARLPAGFDASLAGRRKRDALSAWAARGVRRADGSALPGGVARAALLLPAGVEGPAFIVLRNFDAIYAYNAAESYALAIAHLADRLRGDGPLVARWPTDDPGLSRAERRELQTLLTMRGHDVGPIDGAIGARTREAIVAQQARLGLAPTGRAGRGILEALRRAP